MGKESELEKRSKDRANADVTRRSYETDVSPCEEKFKSSTDVRPQTNPNNTKSLTTLSNVDGGVRGEYAY